MTTANLITGLRLVPFALFVYFAHVGKIMPAAGMFLVAWGLDAVDGLVARRLRQTTSFGFVFDKAVDRLVLVGAILVLVTLGSVPLWGLLLITKEALIIPAVVRQGAHGNGLRGLGVGGRLFSIGQGLGVVWLLFGWPGGLFLATVLGLVGILLGGQYLQAVKAP